MRRLFLIAALLAAVLVASPPVGAQSPAEALAKTLQAEDARVRLVERLQKTVCAIFPAAPEENQPAGPQGSGSGVLIDPDGYALTNYHVVAEATKVSVGLSDGKVYSAVVKGRDPTGDIAVIKIDGGPFPFAELGDSDKLAVGDWALAMGNPFGLATDFRPTVTQGIVSGLHRYLPGTIGGDLVYTDCIQVDAPINPGNSGGPLFDMSGRLIGINGRVSVRPSRGKVNSGVGFAIPINQIKEFLPDLRKGQRVHHAILGVELSEGSPNVSVKQIVAGSAADKAGLQVGDIVRRFQGHEIRSEMELINRIGVLPSGKNARLVIERGGRQYDIEVVLGGRPTSGDTALGLDTSTPDKTPEAPASGEPTPEAVFRRFAEALGGYDAIESIRDTITIGRTRRLLQGRVWADGRIVYYDVGTSLLRHEVTYTLNGNSATQVSFYDGTGGWVTGNGQSVDMNGEMLAAVRAEIEAYDLLTRRDGWKAAQARWAGTETLDGRKLNVIATRDRAGTERRWSFDAETGLLARQIHQDAQGQPVESRISDWRRTGDTFQPFQYSRYVSGSQIETTQVESVEINRGLKEQFLREKPPVALGPRVY